MVRSSSCLVINSPTGYGVGGRGCCKSEVKDGGACSIWEVVCRNVLFIDKLEVVCVGPVDDKICAFGCFDIGVPPWMMGVIELTSSLQGVRHSYYCSEYPAELYLRVGDHLQYLVYY